MTDTLSILGTGVYLPPARPVKEVVAEAGGDSSIFQGWENVCHARDEDHPSSMGADALRRALDDSGVNAADLQLVIFAGMSRDYLPSYSVATEIMKTCDVPGTCVGIDLTIGCLGALSALDLAHGWLAVRGGGLAAIVTAERWSYTIDHSSSESYGLWAHADGGAATIVGINTKHASKAEFAGAETVTQSDLNGSIIIKYGGTQNPVAPEGVNPAEREILTLEGIDRRERYAEGYLGSFQAMEKRFGVRPNRVICNQTAVLFLQLIASVIEIPLENFLITGHETGHVGSADILIGLDRLLKSGELTEPYLMAGSTPFAFASGLLNPA